MTMPLMKPLSGVGQVNVNDDDVDRYKAAGWSEVKSSGGEAKKSASGSKSSAKKK